MNLQILLKVLSALTAVTDHDTNGYAMALSQSLKMIVAGEPDGAAQLNRIIAQSVLNDWPTFNSLVSFSAQVLTQGQPQNLPQAIATFERIATETLPVAPQINMR